MGDARGIGDGKRGKFPLKIIGIYLLMLAAMEGCSGSSSPGKVHSQELNFSVKVLSSSTVSDAGVDPPGACDFSCTVSTRMGTNQLYSNTTAISLLCDANRLAIDGQEFALPSANLPLADELCDSVIDIDLSCTSPQSFLTFLSSLSGTAALTLTGCEDPLSIDIEISNTLDQAISAVLGGQDPKVVLQQFSCAFLINTDSVLGLFCGNSSDSTSGLCSSAQTLEIFTKHNCSVCGNEKCDADETVASCPEDCPAPYGSCGNGACDSCENVELCSFDCGPTGGFCGDGTCNQGENGNNCPEDCSIAEVFCRNPLPDCIGAHCDCDGALFAMTGVHGSTCLNNLCCTAPPGVGFFCGDGILNGEEECDTGNSFDFLQGNCPTGQVCNPQRFTEECTCTTCRNGVCDSGEDPQTCPSDCSDCGDGFVSGGEQCDPNPPNNGDCSYVGGGVCNPSTCQCDSI